MELEELLEELRRYPGLTRKAVIGSWARRFSAISGETVLVQGPGDDAGALPMGDGYLLLAGEGMMPSLWRDPFFTGFGAVTVNVNDIYAMGGRPLGLVSVVFAGGLSDEARDGFMRGMGRALDYYGVPLLGGHTSPEGGPAVAVSIVGYADKLIRGDGARPGDRLALVLDFDGKPYPPFFAWDTVFSTEGERTVEKLEAMTELAERELCSACRDISNPGILGTLAMMMEASGTGAAVDLDSVPVPPGVEIDWWLKAYPSYGFLLALPQSSLEEVTAVVEQRGLICAEFGEVTEGSEITVDWRGSSARFLDWLTHPVTGL
jgi:hypothetical protein